MGLFDKRVAFKPFDYPDASRYKDAINHSYWLVSEWNFIGDQHDFHKTLTTEQRNAVKNAMLAISQIEVTVKRFWTKLGDRFPKAEFEQVGVTFGECEVRHADAYSHLLKVLDLNNDFAALMDVPAIRARVGYLTEALAVAGPQSNDQYAMTLTLFAMFIENVSLFSQFAVIKSFNKHLNVLKDIDNVIQATQKEEAIHALFGAYLVNLIRHENPAWFDEGFYGRLSVMANRAYLAECEIIDWIFEAGELQFLSAETLKEFVKNRLNDSLRMIGARAEFDVDPGKLKPLLWFEEETHAEVSTDFFHKRPVTYSKKQKPITAGDLFG